MSDRTVSADALRIAAEHAAELSELLRVVRLEHRAELLDEFASALADAADGCDVDWEALLDDLHSRASRARHRTTSGASENTNDRTVPKR